MAGDAPRQQPLDVRRAATTQPPQQQPQQQPQQHEHQDTMLGECPALSNTTLLLSPRTSEAAFWGSLRVLRTLDGVGLCNSVLLNVLLIRKFGWGRQHPDWLWHFVPVALYLLAGILQLLLLLLRPHVHQRHRLAINLTNRLVKAATVTWAAVNMSQIDVMVQFAGTLNSAAAGEPSATGVHMAILRTVAGLPLLWLTHAVNFIVPFWALLPLQLITLLAVKPVIPSIVCALLGQPPHIAQAACDLAARMRTCARVVIALAALPMAVQPARPRTAASAAAAAADSPEKDLLWLGYGTFTTILLLIPCLVAYYVELLTKRKFIEAERRRRLAPPTDPSLHCASGENPGERAVWRLLLCYASLDVICVALMLCEAVVEGMAPVTCEAA